MLWSEWDHSDSDNRYGNRQQWQKDMTNGPMKSRRRREPTEGTRRTFKNSPPHRDPYNKHHQSNKLPSKHPQTLRSRTRERSKLKPTAHLGQLDPSSKQHLFLYHSTQKGPSENRHTSGTTCARNSEHLLEYGLDLWLPNIDFMILNFFKVFFFICCYPKGRGMLRN